MAPNKLRSSMGQQNETIELVDEHTSEAQGLWIDPPTRAQYFCRI